MVILKKIDMVDEVMQKLAETGVKGGTIVEGTGMAKALVNMEDIPIFGMLRHMLVDEEKLVSKLLIFVLKEEQVNKTRETIKKVIGDFSEPNTGIMFSIPIKDVEGFGE
ncbi:MAG: hypothetical protein AAGU76_12750 [Sedimentibacter sp.]|uniref:P-II family nitrogen regulator n=1 Tax=Sedimentibacter sp. TaxID=1960295 RepID=UPI00315869C2